MITEPFANIGHCRENLYELMFECYGVPKIMTGVDALFSLYNSVPDYKRY